MTAAPATHAEFDLGALRPLLTDDAVNEVVINEDGRIWVERGDRAHMEPAGIDIEPPVIRRLANHLAGEARAALGPKSPTVSGRVMAWGTSLRVQILVPPAIEDRVVLSIRKYASRLLGVEEFGFLHGRQVNVDAERSSKLREIVRLAEDGALQTALDRAIKERLNILISGGTSSGKTTFARALLSLADHRERLVTIEDAPELHLPHENRVTLVADRKNDSPRSAARLLESALRLRPDRLILGEVRGEEALNFLEAINTGHPGSLTTIHADSPLLALERLVLMVMRTGVRQTRQDVIDYAKSTIDLIVQVGRSEGQRGVLQLHMPRMAPCGTTDAIGA